MYFLIAKSTKNSPTDAYAYNGSGIESESFNAAYGSGNKVLICKVLPQPLNPAS